MFIWASVNSWIPKVTNVVGLICFALALETSGTTSEIWKTLLTVGIGIFVTLVGVIYKNIDKKFDGIDIRFSEMDNRLIQITKDNSDHIERVSARQEKILSSMLSLLLASKGTDPEAIGLIKNIIEKDIHGA